MPNLQSIKETEQRELTPVEDKIQQVFKFLEIADIQQFNGKNIFEAADADALHDILVTAFEQHEKAIREDERERVVEMVEEELKENDKESQKDIPGGKAEAYSRGIRMALRKVLSSLQEKQ